MFVHHNSTDKIDKENHKAELLSKRRINVVTGIRGNCPV